MHGDNSLNQSKLEVITRSRPKARENVHARAMICFGFTSDWLKEWRENFEPIIEWSNAKPKQFTNYFRHSIENRSTSLSDWFKVLAPLFQPNTSETKTNRGSRVRIFPRFVSATCNDFEFWLVHWIVSVLFDWPKQLLWFWFYDTRMKLALSTQLINPFLC